MEEVTRETILYLRDVLGLSFYQIEQRTGVSRKLASSLYCPPFFETLFKL